VNAVDIYFDENNTVTAVERQSELYARNVVGWSVVGELSLEKLVLRRPPACMPRQGSKRRMRTKSSPFTAEHLAFLRENIEITADSKIKKTASNAVLSEKSKNELGEDLMLESEQIGAWAQSQLQNRKAAASRALERVGKPNYDHLNTLELEALLDERTIKWSSRCKDPGKRRLLEDYDDEHPAPAAVVPTSKKKRKKGGLSKTKHNSKSKSKKKTTKRARRSR
jgi:hypothetical protein